MNDRPVSLWAYKEGESKSDLFYHIDMATDMIAQKCGLDIKLLVIKKDGLDSIPHSILGRKIYDEVKVPYVNPTNIIGIHDIDYNNMRHRIDIDGVRSKFSSKRFLTRIYKKYKKLSVNFEDFLQKFYFHFTCGTRIQSIKAHGIVSSSEPSIDIDGGRRAIRRKKITYRKRRKNFKNTQKKKQSKTKSKTKSKSKSKSKTKKSRI
tara:strand:- start:410 stop:1027 length:618 start_codon:yes stop_codon:yes gene_type:complete